MERPRRVVIDGIPQDSKFAAMYLRDAEVMDRSLNLSESAGLRDPVDIETMRMYLGLRQLREEASVFRREGMYGMRGVSKPFVHFIHRRLGISDPFQAAINTFESAYEAHVSESYTGESRDKAFRIQASVNDLIARITVRHVMRGGFGSAFVFDRWEPTREIVANWGNAWKDRLATQTPQGL